VQRGTYGDMFAAVNALFSGLAFAGVGYAIYAKRHEISIAKEELDRTKEIMEQQTKQNQSAKRIH
jgi:hypothetical protein